MDSPSKENGGAAEATPPRKRGGLFSSLFTRRRRGAGSAGGTGDAMELNGKSHTAPEGTTTADGRAAGAGGVVARDGGHGHGHGHGHGGKGGWRRTLRLAFATLGIIYGDIGTSPLYVMTAVFEGMHSAEGEGARGPAPEDVLGALSLICWSITIVVIIKYVGFMLTADDHGEGGAFAMCALLSRGLRRILRPEGGDDDGEGGEGVAEEGGPNDRKFALANAVVYGVAMVSAAAAFGDGVLTPAISVLSAVEGLAVPTPVLSVAVIPLTLAILTMLFLVQRFGTAKVAAISAPTIALWLISLAGIGVWNLTYAPTVLRALSPSYAVSFFVRNGTEGWIRLGAVVLSITGVEALYADLGHFSRPAIRLSCLTVTYPCVVLAYLGQGARLYLDPSLAANAFYRTLPGPLYYPVLALATLATVIASQAMISASFSIIHQAVRLGCFPRVHVIHTDPHSEGQVYVPAMNWFLMVACLAVVLAFRSAANLATAYGVAVCANMLIDTATYSLALRVHFNRRWWASAAFFLFFGSIDAAFLSANLTKFLNGGWFPLALASVLATTMFVWRWGRLRLTARVRALALPYGSSLGRFLLTHADGGGNWWERDQKYRKSGWGQASASSKYASLEDDTMAPLPDSDGAATADGARMRAANGSQIDLPADPAAAAAAAAARPSATPTTLTVTAAAPTVAVPDLIMAQPYDTRPPVPGVYLFYTSVSDAVPAAYMHLVRLLPCRPAHVIFVTVDVVNVPRVEPMLRFAPVPGQPGLYRAVVLIGYMEDPPIASRLAPRVLRVFAAEKARAAAAAATATATATAAKGATSTKVEEMPLVEAIEGAGAGEEALDDVVEEQEQDNNEGDHVDSGDAGGSSAGAGGAGEVPSRTLSPRPKRAGLTDGELLALYNPTFLLGRDRVVSVYGAGRVHRALVTLFQWEMKLSRSILGSMKIPPARALEVGFMVEI
jgi:KUP system potassium uptake protein